MQFVQIPEIRQLMHLQLMHLVDKVLVDLEVVPFTLVLSQLFSLPWDSLE